MAGFWALRTKKQQQQPGVSDEFRHALMQEVLRTELTRIKVILVTLTVLLAFLSLSYLVVPRALERIWHDHFPVASFYLAFIPFALFELSVMRVIRQRLAQGRDIPYGRRYLGVLIETSLPTYALYLQMNAMGPEEALGFVVPLMYVIFIILSTLRLDFWLSAFTGLVAASQLYAMAMFYRSAQFPDVPDPGAGFHLVRSLVILVCGILAGLVGMQLRRQFESSTAAVTARDRITNLFGQHVSPQVVERLMEEGRAAASDLRHVAVMFVDFRSFTAAARSRTPQDVVDRLDGAFAVLVEVLERHGGIVNKFLGDGFLALFGAPFDNADAAQHAVAAAREMIAAMDHINAASDWPLRIGIGIHFGEVVAGSIGSPRRKEYTVIGDTVNFASRLEALNKEFNSHLLVSAAVRDALGETCDAVSLGEVPVRGYERPIAVWQLA